MPSRLSPAKAVLTVSALTVASLSVDAAVVTNTFDEFGQPLAGNLLVDPPKQARADFLAQLKPDSLLEEEFKQDTKNPADNLTTPTKNTFLKDGSFRATMQSAAGFVLGESNSDGNFLGRFDTTIPTREKNVGFWFETDADPTDHDPDETWSVKIKFDSAVNAFGLYLTDFGDFGATLNVTFIGPSGSASSSVTSGNQQNGGLNFFGVYTDFMFDEVLFAMTQPKTCSSAPCPTDTIGFDSMAAGIQDDGRSVPTSGSLALAALGLALLSGTRRRQTR